jgi:hypothetical protein
MQISSWHLFAIVKQLYFYLGILYPCIRHDDDPWISLVYKTEHINTNCCGDDAIVGSRAALPNGNPVPRSTNADFSRSGKFN